MNNIVPIKSGKPAHEDRFFLVFTFVDGEVKAFEGDYVGHDVQYPPVMVVLSGPEETQVPVAAVNTEHLKYVQYIPKGDVTYRDGNIEFPETEVEMLEDQEDEVSAPWNAGYV